LSTVSGPISILFAEHGREIAAPAPAPIKSSDWALHCRFWAIKRAFKAKISAISQLVSNLFNGLPWSDPEVEASAAMMYHRPTWHPSRAVLLCIGWLLLSALPPAASAFALRDDLPTLDKCRFLMAGAGTEQRQPLAPERRQALHSLLEQTPIGSMVATYLQRFASEGVGGGIQPMQFHEVELEGGPAASYFESGEMHLSSRLFAEPGADAEETRDRLYTAASFVVHEGIHAIAHHLHVHSRFPIYRADAKVNEALAFFVQGLYLDEVRELEPTYQEVKAVPAWDHCTAQIVKILGELGITPDTSLDDAYDLLAELQLESDDATALRLARLWHYLQFIHDSDESERLWALGEADPVPLAVVATLTEGIAYDVEHRQCNFDRTFDLMRNRIILYAHYPDTPPGVPGCQYFSDFVNALREEGEISKALREQIDLWLIRQGLRTAPEDTE
jgi:hypothetical protein